MHYDNPLIVQSDKTLLLDVHASRSQECRMALIPFAELEKSPEHLHTYRLTPLSLWNACSAGLEPEKIISCLEDFSRYDVPPSVKMWILSTATRFGKIVLREPKENEIEDESEDASVASSGADATTSAATNSGATSEDATATEKSAAATETATKLSSFLVLECATENICKEVFSITSVSKYLIPCEIKNSFLIKLTYRGTIKQELLKMDWPVKDDAPLKEGAPLEINLRKTTLSNKDFLDRKSTRLNSSH